MKNCYRCLKFSVAMLNFIIMFLGLLILGLFLWIYLDVSAVSQVHSAICYVIYFFLGLGTLMTFIGLLGFCGSLRESQCMLGMTLFMVFVIWGGQIAVSVWTYQNINLIEKGFQVSMRDYLHLYNKSETVTASIDIMQSKAECCGATGFHDWEGDVAPFSCCKYVNEICNKQSAFSKGCAEKVFDWIKHHQTAILIFGCTISVVLILDLIFNFIMCLAFRSLGQY